MSGISMLFKDLATTFEALEHTSSRNEMISVLADLLKNATVSNIDAISYFTLGQIDAEYKTTQLGIGEEITKSALSHLLRVSKESIDREMKRNGDLGLTIERLLKQQKRKSTEKVDRTNRLSIEEVRSTFLKIAQMSGTKAQQTKEQTLVRMLAKAEPREAKYIVRLTTRTMRLGVGDMTFLDALATSFLSSKNFRDQLESAYNVTSDIGLVAKTLLKNGLKGVEKIQITLNHPIRPMLAQRISSLSEISEKISSMPLAAEEKYDGERIQAHIKGGQVHLFSRHLTDVTTQFPDVVAQIKKAIKVKNAIVDGEVVAYDFDRHTYFPFQKLMQRRRKYKVTEYAKKIPVKYMLFDILYLNGESLLTQSYPLRRKKLEQVIKETKYLALAKRITSSNFDEIEEFFQESVENGLEGIVIKSCNEESVYLAGAREWTWIKWKPEYQTELADTLDLVVVGAYAGKGKRAGTYGALLGAVYNKDQDVYQTLCKIGSGFSEEQLSKLPNLFREVITSKQPARIQVSIQIVPDEWLLPHFVIEVKGANITYSPLHTANWDSRQQRGLALRFPRFLRWRHDKRPEEVTTVDELLVMLKEKDV
jgi:DNA ligase-1